MATRRKLTLVNGAIDQEGSVFMYQTVKSVEVYCAPYSFLLLFPSCPFPMMTIGTILISLSEPSLF